VDRRADPALRRRRGEHQFAIRAHRAARNRSPAQVMPAVEQRGSGRPSRLLVRHGEIAGSYAGTPRGPVHRRGRVRSVRASSPGVTVWTQSGGGRDEAIVPAGLGARDTLRLRPRCGCTERHRRHDDGARHADLDWIIGWNKGDFLAVRPWRVRKPRRCQPHRRLRDEGTRRDREARLSGDRRGAAVGRVTSGTQTPFLKKAIGMAYVPSPTRRRAPSSTWTSGRLARATVVRCRSTTTERVTCIQPTASTRKTTSGSKVTGETRAGGITDYAPEAAGRRRVLDLPQVGRALKVGESFGPWSRSRPFQSCTARCRGSHGGHSALAEKPEKVNADPTRAG